MAKAPERRPAGSDDMTPFGQARRKSPIEGRIRHSFKSLIQQFPIVCKDKQVGACERPASSGLRDTEVPSPVAPFVKLELSLFLSKRACHKRLHPAKEDRPAQ